MENTVLIVGAGLSKPYGYPSGPELLNSIKNNYIRSENRFEKQLAEAISAYAPTSIDRFLHQNSNFYKVGIRLISAEILRYEFESKEADMADDIIGFILNLIDDPASTNAERIKIITFNYDRLLEWRILQRLSVRFKDDPFKVREVFDKFEIEHIHGSLPSLFDNSLNLPYGLKNYTTAERTGRYAAVKDWASGEDSPIRTVFASDNQPSSKTIETIKWADRLFFLGFAYEDLNMKKLGFNNPEVHYHLSAKAIAGTAYQVPPVERKRIERQYPMLSGRLFDTTAIDFFKKHISLVDPQDDIESNLRSVKANCCTKYAYQERPNQPTVGFTYRSDFQCPDCKKIGWVTYTRKGDQVWKVRFDRDEFPPSSHRSSRFELERLDSIGIL